MSPASKSKSNDKKTAREPTKASGKLAGSANGSGVPSSAYNPFLGSFHALEIETSSSALSIHSNGRFQSIDENSDHYGNFVGTAGEFDASSNNGSWSGESDEHKEKSTGHSMRQESIPGTENDKREKIRQKNERKHQRQKERRAQELHEKCGGYLMSRKLEYLSQQLVAMGFSAERATMALILNEGKVDQSVTWLLDEGAEEAEKDKQRDQDSGASGNLKIDIAEELARLADLEIRYKCSRQEVERAVVACEGDLDKAAEILKTQKQEPPAGPPAPEETGGPPNPPSPAINGVEHSSIANQSLTKAPPRFNSSISTASQVREEKDFNYTRSVVTAGTLPDNSKNSVQLPPKRAQIRADWAKTQQLVAPVTEKRWPVLGTIAQIASPLQVSPQPLKGETRYAATGSEFRNTQQLGTVREPVTVMQRQQPNSSKPFVVTSIATSTHTALPSWHPIGGSDFATNGAVAQIPSLRNFSSNNMTPNQLQQQLLYQHKQQALASSNPLDVIRHQRTNNALSKLATSSSLTPATSLGLFSGTISPNAPTGSSPPVNWSNGYDMRQIDYASIDWSLGRSAPPLSPSIQGSSLWSNGGEIAVSPTLTRNGMGISRPGARPVSSSNGSSNGSGTIPTTTTMERGEAVDMGDWSSPFEERDIFSSPRQYVSSHSMYEDHGHTHTHTHTHTHRGI